MTRATMGRWTRRELAEGAALCLEMGSGLLENGAETSRVEETVRMAGDALGLTAETIVTPTAITVTFGNGEVITRVARIRERVIDLDKVDRLNGISRELQLEPEPNLGQLREKVQKIRQAPPLYSETHQIVATATACACYTISLGGGWEEATWSISAGVLGRILVDMIGSGFPSFLSLFFVAFLSTMYGVGAHEVAGLATEPIVVGSLLSRMPGLAIVSAVRDLMAGELVAGVARAAEAMLVTLGMASGVLACLGFALRFGLVGGQ